VDSYQLRGAHIGPQTILEISADRHAELARARQCLVDAGNFERRYALLVGNFLALEEFTALTHLRGEVLFDIGYETGDAILMEANRHIINFFTSAKAYIDQAYSDFKQIGEEDWFRKQAESQFKAAFARSIHYRISDQLRSKGQHRAMPVDGYGPGPSEAEAGIWFYATKEMLSKDKKFRKSTLAEAPDKIYLRTTLRGYMHELSTVHVALRKLVKKDVDECRKTVEDAIEDYREAQEDPKSASRTGIGLESAHYAGKKLVQAVPLLLNWDNNRISLEKKHMSRVKLPF
jgi:hypothetical protein